MNLKSLKRRFYDHGISMHAQNLNERQGASDGPMWQYGRAWIYGFDGDGDTGKEWRKTWEINPTWKFGMQPRDLRPTGGVLLELGGGDSSREITLALDVCLAQFYLSLDIPRLYAAIRHVQPYHLFDRHQVIAQYRPSSGERFAKMYEPREISLRWHSGGLWWSLWQHPHEWNSRESKWRRGHWDLVDSLFGRMDFERVEIGSDTIEVPMPEKSYTAAVKLERFTWRRRRWRYWPLTRTARMADIKVPGGIPHPGKGENAWDCDDDATYSLSCRARTAEEAAGRFVASVLRSRRRYGGKNWRPRDKATA